MLALLAGLAVWRTRPVACRGTVENRRGRGLGLLRSVGRVLPGPSLDRNPVLRVASFPTLALDDTRCSVLMGTTATFCVAGAVAFWQTAWISGEANAWAIAGVVSYVLHVSFGLLMLSAIAPTSMAEERQRGSLDILAATTLSSREIVIGKWMGTFRLVFDS